MYGFPQEVQDLPGGHNGLTIINIYHCGGKRVNIYIIKYACFLTGSPALSHGHIGCSGLSCKGYNGLTISWKGFKGLTITTFKNSYFYHL